MENQHPSRYTVTAALPYANGPVHIGHLAGVYVPADIYARYLRMAGKDVAFICGSDEHGVPITLRAKNEGVSPEEIVERYHQLNKESFEKFGISFDVYARTSDKKHYETASEFFLHLYNKGVFTEETSEQFYDEENEQFLADRYIQGECPKCGYEEAYGDQCEKCGTSLSSNELINPVSVLSGKTPVKKETKHWYLPLDKYENWLRQWILEEHKEWKTNVYGQCKSWLDQGLNPRAVTRDLDWGVPVPVEGADGKVLYVWFDAPIGYISATKEWAESVQKDWKDYWQDEHARLVHFIGKDNIVFHCIIFPVMLRAHGDYILPDNVPANEFLNLEGRKLSTSKNWAVWLHEYLEDFPGKEDVLRYVLTANLPETKDNDFSWYDFQAKNNNELVSIYGNFVNRAVVLTHKYFDGVVPERDEQFYDIDKEVQDKLAALPDKVADNLENYRFREALFYMMELARAGNKYLADTEPWKLIKQDEARVKTILNISLQVVANLYIVSQPFLPETGKKLLSMLNFRPFSWQDAGGIDLVTPGHVLNKAELLFDKISDATVQDQMYKLWQKSDMAPQDEAAEDVEPLRQLIDFEDFSGVDIRTGRVIEASRVPDTDKLLKLKIDTGVDERTVVSGIAKYYSPDQVSGKQVCVLANLAPKRIRGIDSQGMVLTAKNPDGSLRLITPDDDVTNGSVIQ